MSSFFKFELLYIEVLYTIKHKIGITIGGHLPFIQDLYQYAQEAFRVSPEDHARLLAQATKEKVTTSLTFVKTGIIRGSIINRGYCMSAHKLLNLLNELRKKR